MSSDSPGIRLVTAVQKRKSDFAGDTTSAFPAFHCSRFVGGPYFERMIHEFGAQFYSVTVCRSPRCFKRRGRIPGAAFAEQFVVCSGSGG
jgi:hypothetical protein